MRLSERQMQEYVDCPPISDDEEDLIGCWDFEEGEDNIYDLSANENNGMLNGVLPQIQMFRRTVLSINNGIWL